MVTHLIGTIASLAALALFVTFAAIQGEPWRIVTLSVFGTALVAMYLISTLAHVFDNPKRRDLISKIEHIAIAVLIAATYTPLMLVVLGGAWGWTVFGLAWALALASIAIRLGAKRKYQPYSTGMYLIAGWLVLLVIGPLAGALTTAGLVLLAVGGLAYSLGALFYHWHALPFQHAIWHGLALVGSICHAVVMCTDVLIRTN